MKAEDHALHEYYDASFTDAKGARITSGYIIKLVEDPMAWKTHRQSFVLLSTCQVELSRYVKHFKKWSHYITQLN